MKHAPILSLALACLAPLPATAKSPILGLDGINVIGGWRQSDGTHMAAVHIDLEKGWKTYWRVAGGGGIPPTFDWSGSTNIKSSEIKWPAPQVFDDYDTQTIGYKDSLILPIVFTAKDPTKPMAIGGMIDFGVCENVCVPVQAKLSEILPPRVAMGKSQIKAALRTQAKSGAEAGVKLTDCEFAPINDGFKISANLKSDSSFSKSAIGIVEYPIGQNDWLQQQPSTISGYNLTAQATLYANDVAFIDRSKLRVTVLQNGKAIEMLGCR